MAETSEMVTLITCSLFCTVFFQFEVDGVPFAGNRTGSYDEAVCSRSDPDVDECVRQRLTAAFKYYKQGNEALGLPPLEPLLVPFLEVSHDKNNLTLEISLKDILISGFTDIQLAKVKVNLEDVYKLEVTAKTPVLTITGQYTSEGLIVTFPLHSAGAFTINMTDVTSSWIVYLREVTRAGDRYLEVDRFQVDMIPVNISFQPAEELDGDNHLGEAVSVILNENSSEVYSMLKTRLTEVFSELLTQLADAVLTKVPESAYLRP